ncbi:MAG: response regulator [Acidobacteria bacterium]|nr:response regulator [Acidobacteriota bacterium]
MYPPKKTRTAATEETGRADRPESVQKVVTLAVSPFREDRISLRQIFSHTRWKLQEADTLGEAVELVREQLIPVVVSESKLPDGNWKDLLERLSELPHPPCLIVSSRLPDDHLWAEVLNLGGYDLLPKPFDSREVTRVISLAWLHWKGQWERAFRSPKVLRAT